MKVTSRFFLFFFSFKYEEKWKVLFIYFDDGVYITVQALIGIKASLHDPHGVLDNWDGDAVDPCSWTMVTCSPESLVIGL
jgi:hypothetical protein